MINDSKLDAALYGSSPLEEDMTKKKLKFPIFFFFG